MRPRRESPLVSSHERGAGGGSPRAKRGTSFGSSSAGVRDPPRQAHRQTAHPFEQIAPVERLHQEMDVVRLHRVVNDSKSQPAAPIRRSDRAPHRRKHELRPQRLQTHPQRHVHRIRSRMLRSCPMRHRSPRLRLSARLSPRATPATRELQLELLPTPRRHVCALHNPSLPLNTLDVTSVDFKS